MKNFQDIFFSSLDHSLAPIKKRFLSTYGQRQCIERLYRILPATLLQGTRRIYLRHHTLYFEFINPALKTEFHYKLSLIKSLLNTLSQAGELCKDAKNWDIKSYYTLENDPLPLQSPPSWECRYREKSEAQFYNHATHPALHELFEKFRTIIESDQSLDNDASNHRIIS